MNWGHGIVLAIVGFVAIIMTMVVISVRMTGIELVTDDYYAQEIDYQNQIDRETFANQLDRQVIEFDGQSKTLLFDLPKGTEANLELFRPSDETLDQQIDFQVETDTRTSVSVAELKRGYWRVQLRWQENGVELYEEKKISI
ncbi:FixH family protein [Algoriphagus sediminis]|uniref:FixH family protein n=1 Tax=Algoriphagus sediminis TaxID=3057113 RepID=A0ABT7Y9F7_9BACT|nr:FixH family protein [Algoriphagus sediminis]MDN3203152.1 FixH family protein [Algoriphagus sediminis]